MEELIFLALLVVFTILEAVFKKRRQGEEPEEEGAGPDLEDRSRGELGAPRPEWTTEGRTEASRREPSSSEAMVPRDLWEEIAALARGERPGQDARGVGRAGGEGAPAPGPASEPDWRTAPGGLGEPVPTTAPVRRSELGRREIGSGGTVRRRPRRSRRPELGADPSERRPFAEPPRSRTSAEVRAVRRALVEGGASEARKAVILHEVLGKPLAYRDEGPGGAGS